MSYQFDEIRCTRIVNLAYLLHWSFIGSNRDHSVVMLAVFLHIITSIVLLVIFVGLPVQINQFHVTEKAQETLCSHEITKWFPEEHEEAKYLLLIQRVPTDLRTIFILMISHNGFT